MNSSLPDSARPLSAIETALVDLARATIDANTDAEPHTEGIHTMGAAVRAADGRMYVGVNLYHFTGGPCAELVALGSARAAGARELTHIVAVGNHGRGVKSPCGRDRQVLMDYYPDIRVILATTAGLLSITPPHLPVCLLGLDEGPRPFGPRIPFIRHSRLKTPSALTSARGDVYERRLLNCGNWRWWKGQLPVLQ